MRLSKKINRIILTGHDGLLGVSVHEHLRLQGFEVLVASLDNGVDLTSEEKVLGFFAANKADAMIVMHAINPAVINGSALPTGPQSLLDVSVDSFSDFMNVNVVSLFSVCKAFMQSNKSGRIITFSSIYGLRTPRPAIFDRGIKHPGYSVSKAAVIALTSYLAAHCGPKYRINGIALGGVESNQGAKFVRKYSAIVPLGRMAHQSDLNSTLDYLLDERTDYLHGTTVVLDGGFTL